MLAGKDNSVVAVARPISLISATYITMAAVSAVVLVLVRTPMGEPRWTAAFKAFLLSGGVMLTWQETARRVLDGTFCSYALALLAVIAVLFSPVVIWIGPSVAEVFLYVFLGLIWVFGLRSLIAGLRQEPWWNSLVAVASGCVLGCAYFLIVNTKGYANVFSPEQALFGVQHRDTLFHASLAATFAKFGVASTGLDGPVPVSYHALSHFLTGTIARWAAIAPIHAYYLAPQIVSIPLLLFSMTAAAFWLGRFERTAANAALFVLVPLLLLLLFEMRDWASYLVSESYCLSLILFLLSLPLLVELAERPRVACDWARYLVLGAVGLAMLYAKNSVAAVFACGVYYALVRPRGITPLNLLKFGLPIVLIGAVGIWATVSEASSSGSAFPVNPLHFLRAYPDGAWSNIIAIGLMVGAAVLLWLAADGPRAIVIEVLVVLALASLVSALLLEIAAGSAYYFLNVGAWVSIVFGAGMVVVPPLATLERPRLIAGAVAACAVCALLLGPQLRDSEQKLATLLGQLRQHGQPTALLPASPLSDDLSWLRVVSPFDPVRAQIAEAARVSPGGRMLNLLTRYDTLSSRDTAVYVPPGNTAFWNLSTLCTAAPFFIPALAGVPMLYGLPPDREKCPIDAVTGFGYGSYGDASRSTAVADPQLCERARRSGYARIIVLDDTQNARALDCH